MIQSMDSCMCACVYMPTIGRNKQIKEKERERASERERDRRWSDLLLRSGAIEGSDRGIEQANVHRLSQIPKLLRRHVEIKSRRLINPIIEAQPCTDETLVRTLYIHAEREREREREREVWGQDSFNLKQRFEIVCFRRRPSLLFL